MVFLKIYIRCSTEYSRWSKIKNPFTPFTIIFCIANNFAKKEDKKAFENYFISVVLLFFCMSKPRPYFKKTRTIWAVYFYAIYTLFFIIKLKTCGGVREEYFLSFYRIKIVFYFYASTVGLCVCHWIKGAVNLKSSVVNS